MKKILILAHCLLNTASKLKSSEEGLEAEDKLRKKLIQLALEKDMHILQLPCPEFTLYGPRRWGHAKKQFENPFFRRHSQEILQPIVDQIEAYYQEDELFEVVAVVGVDGSPSCGVDYTYSSDHWLGEFSGRPSDIKDDLKTIEREKKPGYFMEILKEELDKRNIPMNFVGLFADEPEKVIELIINA